LTFVVGEELYALPISEVEHITAYAEPRVIPDNDSQYLHALVQIRGGIMPVNDLREQFGFPMNLNELTSYIVCYVGEKRWALVVDRAERMIEIPEENIQQSSSKSLSLIGNVARWEDKLLTLLNLSVLENETIEQNLLEKEGALPA